MLPFGVEFEFEVPGRWIDRDRSNPMGGAGFAYSIRREEEAPPEAERVAEALTAAGLETVARGHTRVHTRAWKVIPEPAGGLELVSPILFDENGVDRVGRACGVLASLGAQTDPGYGFHVHVDASDLSLDVIKGIARTYAHFEGALDLLMPPLRRADRNGMALSMAPILPRIERAATKDDLFRAVFAKRHRTVNLMALRHHGTIEFRHHGSTVDWVEAESWVRAVQAIVAIGRTRSPRRAVPVSGLSAYSRLGALLGDPAFRPVAAYYRDRVSADARGA